MAGTYWLTILPETSKLVAGIRAAVKSVDDGISVTITPEVDDSGARRQGRGYGSRYSRGFSEAAKPTVRPTVDERAGFRDGEIYGSRFENGFSRAIAGIGGGLLRGVGNGFSVLSGTVNLFGESVRTAGKGVQLFVTYIGTAASALGLVSRYIRLFSVASLAGAVGLKAISNNGQDAVTALRSLGGVFTKLENVGMKAWAWLGIDLSKTANGIHRVARVANDAATQVARVTSALIAMRAAVQVTGFLVTASKIMGVLTLGAVALYGAVAALGMAIWNPLIGALTTAGAAMGIAAGAAIGLLAPAIGVLKIGFKGLSEGAKEFNKQFGDADEAFGKMIGERMGPMLTAFRSLRQSIIDTFSSTLQPAFTTLGGVLDGMKPRLAPLVTTFGLLGNEIAGAFASPSMTASLDKMVAASNRFFQSFLGESGLSGITTGFAAFAATAADTFARVGKPINDWLLQMGERLRNITPLQMELTFAALRNVIKSVGDVVMPVIRMLKDVGMIAAPALAPGMRSLGQAFTDMRPGVMEMARILMPALSQVLTNLAPLLPTLVQAFTPWAQIFAVLAPVIATVITNLGPLAPLLMTAVLAFKAGGVALVAYNAAMFAYNIGQGVMAAVTGAGTAALRGNAIALTACKVASIAATVAARALGIAMMIATGPIGLIIAAVAAVGIALWSFFTKTETGKRVWAAAVTGIKTVASTVFEWLKTAVNAVGDVLSWLWNNAAKPAFEGIGKAVEVMWNAVGAIFENFLKPAIKLVGDAIWYLWTVVAKPAFDGIGLVVSTMWNGVKVIWDGFTAALDKVGEKVGIFKDTLSKAFNAVKDVVLAVWDKIGGIIDKIGDGVGAVGDLLGGAGKVIVNTLGLDGNAAGGQIVGPGTGTSDSILARVSNGEYIINAASTSRYLPLIEAINSNAMPAFSDGGLALSPGKGAEGGLQGNSVMLARLLSHMFPQIGSIGGFRANGGGYTDHPEGRALDIMIPNYQSEDGIALGNTITAFLMQNKDKLNVDYTIWRQTYRSASGGSNVMDSQGNDTADHFDHVHVTTKAGSPGSYNAPKGLKLPGGTSGMDGQPISGSVGGSLSASGDLMTYRTATDAELTASGNKVTSTSKAVRDGEQRIDDLNFDIEEAQRSIDKLASEGKSTVKAERGKFEKERELEDATTDLADKRAKAAEAMDADEELRTSGKQIKADSSAVGSSSAAGGGNDVSSLGQSFVSGILEAIGLDGSLFSNPLEWPTVKSAMAGVNFLGGLMSGGEGDATAAGGGGTVGGFASGAADAVGLGGMLSAIPTNVTDFGQSGSPQLAAGEFNPAVAGGVSAASSGSMSAFVPHGQGAGGAPGPAVDNSINFNGNVGMAPADLRTQMDSANNARTRTTKVSG